MAATGGATEVLQGFVNQGLGEISKEVSDGEFKPITLEQVGNEALQNAYVGTLAGGALATPLASITAVGEYRNRNKLTPEQTMQHVQNINENVRSNKLFQRSQEAFKSLADSVAGDEKLYVNAQAALDTINSLDQPQRDALFAAVPELKTEIETAAHADNDISIRKADYATYIAPYSQADALVGHIKLDPSDMSVAERQMMQDALTSNPELANAFKAPAQSYDPETLASASPPGPPESADELLSRRSPCLCVALRSPLLDNGILSLICLP